ncbi:MAG: hypothetical protein RLZZ262_1813 [Bacteroidota bacterium]|jgi:gliding motility-associated-like protein
MMKALLIILSILCCPFIGGSQLVLERQAIVAGGVVTNWGGGTAEYSIGQIGTGVYFGDEYSAVLGFHQPNSTPPLFVEIKTWLNDCDKSYEVEIVSITGCNPNASISIQWNNYSADMHTKNLPAQSTLRITTSDGCVFVQPYDLSTRQPVLLPCDLIPFNYLTPNGDGSNDYFHIENIDRPNYTGARVMIYNRWGQLIWEGKNYDNVNVRWTGMNSGGNAVPAGTYYYTIDVIGTTLTGYVELMQ